MAFPDPKETSEQLPSTLNEWTEWLRDQEMPIFSNTAQRIYRIMEEKSSGAMELSGIILQDPNLTARLLKLSNTPYYNPSNQKMGTVTRAIVILGFEVIRELTLACSFIESILSNENKDYVNHEIALAIHAAVQAKSLAQLTRDTSPEEVFVAAMLKNIGSIAFWCYGHQYGERIEKLTQEQKLDAGAAEKTILGFQIKQLGMSLSRTWKLGGLIEEAIAEQETPRTALVQLGHAVANGAMQGWNPEAMQPHLEKLETLTGLGSEDLKALLKRNADTAVKIAGQFGAHDAAELIPTTLSSHRPRRNIQAAATTQEFELDTQLQFQILQDIGNVLTGTINLGTLFEMIIEGIHRVIGMDHTLFTLLSPDRKHLKERFSIGYPAGDHRPVAISLADGATNLFSYAIHQPSVSWIRPEKDTHLRNLFTAPIQKQLGIHECMLMPIHINRRIIGVIYADRSIKRRPFNQESLESFKHFIQQANIGLAISQTQPHESA